MNLCIALILLCSLLPSFALETPLTSNQRFLLSRTFGTSPLPQLILRQTSKVKSAVKLNYLPRSYRLYSEELKRDSPIKGPQDLQQQKLQSKWRKEEFYSPTFWARSVGISAGIIVTGGIAWWSYNFERRQAKRTEHMSFLAKTRDYLNDELRENTELFSHLYANARYDQSLIQYFRPPEERVALIKKYLVFDQKIGMSLDYYDNLKKRLGTIHPYPFSGEHEHELLQAVWKDLKIQNDNLTFAKYLNKTLLYIELESYGLAEQNLNQLIDTYMQKKNIDINNAASYKDHGPLLSIFYNLRALAKIKQADLNLKYNEEFLDRLEQILKDDLIIAERLDLHNSYTYEHKFFIYLALRKHRRLIDSKAYELELKENAIKSYKLSPNNPAALNVMAIYKCLLQEYFAALVYLEKALALLPGCPSILSNLALTHLHVAKHRHLPQHYVKALQYARQAYEQTHDYKALKIYVEASAESGECFEAYSHFRTLEEVCVDYVPCKRNAKLGIIEALLKEKCQNKMASWQVGDKLN